MEGARTHRQASLSSLEDAARLKASALDFDEQLAAVAYAICAIEPESLQGHLWLGRALATLGDGDGALEVFGRAALIAVDEADRRGVAAAYARAKRCLAQAPSSPECTLMALRERSWAGVDEAIQWAQINARGFRRCRRCDGWGYINWFREHDRGRCYACNGTGHSA
jgi:hypothetical protein